MDVHVGNLANVQVADFSPAANSVLLTGLEAITTTPHLDLQAERKVGASIAHNRPLGIYQVHEIRGHRGAIRLNRPPHLIPAGHGHLHGHFNLTMDMSKLSPDQQHWVREHQRLHEKHKGHETMHVEMLLILLATLFLAQVLLVQWKQRHFRSYERATLLGMCFIPFACSIYFHWFRFVIVWTLFSIVTGFVTFKATRKPLAGGTPRLVYKWFLFIYKLSYALGMIGYFIIMFTLFGLNMIFLIKFQVAMDVGLLILFYGLYFGVVTRDFAEVCSDTMAAQVGFYTPSGLPNRHLDRRLCAVCGHPTSTHGTNRSSVSSTDSRSNIRNWYMPQDSEESDSDSAEESRNLSAVPGERTYKLTCGHLFHEFCIRGWCIVGKKQTCPYCKEKVDLKRMFPGPWERPHVLYGNLLDWIRYLIVWQPVIIVLVQAITWTLGLE